MKVNYHTLSLTSGTIVPLSPAPEPAVPVPPPLKLEVGCWYRRRDGKVVGPVTERLYYEGAYPFNIGSGYKKESYTSAGAWTTESTNHRLDLIEKVDPPAPVVDPESRIRDLESRLAQTVADYAARCNAYDKLNTEHGVLTAKAATLRDENIAACKALAKSETENEALREDNSKLKDRLLDIYDVASDMEIDARAIMLKTMIA